MDILLQGFEEVRDLLPHIRPAREAVPVAVTGWPAPIAMSSILGFITAVTDTESLSHPRPDVIQRM
jgi:hypothetical protein